MIKYVVYVQNGILFIHHKEQNADTYCNTIDPEDVTPRTPDSKPQ